MKHRFRYVGYFVLWDARRQLEPALRDTVLTCVRVEGLIVLKGASWVAVLFNCVTPE